MSQDIAIEVTDLSKTYNGVTVLDSVSFSIKKGENVGIIGPNGAGKSTLLKILSDVLRPDKGRAVLNGSVSSILEIGMGLHPELSGRENVFFAGRMMGCSKQHVRSKLEEIIAFSELDGHMDKAVKFYSSGMFLRLAFSIYTLLDTDILLLDEVLSVGDASFRRKSFERMVNYRNEENRSVILVSHSLNDIENFCDRAIYLDRGLKMDSSNIRKVILGYMKDHPLTPKVLDPEWIVVNSNQDDDVPLTEGTLLLPDNDYFRLTKVELLKNGNEPCRHFSYQDEITVQMAYEQFNDGVALSFVWKLFDMNDNMLLASSPLFRKERDKSSLGKGCYSESTVIPAHFFNTGRYYWSLVCTSGGAVIDTYHSLISFEVEQDEWMTTESWSNIPAPILRPFKWSRKSIDHTDQ